MLHNQWTELRRTKTTNHPQCHHGVVVITCALHAQGPQFKPAWWQDFFINGCCTAFPASTTKNRPSKTATHTKRSQNHWIGPKNLKAFIKILPVITHVWMIRIGPIRIKLPRLRALNTDCKKRLRFKRIQLKSVPLVKQPRKCELVFTCKHALTLHFTHAVSQSFQNFRFSWASELQQRKLKTKDKKRTKRKELLFVQGNKTLH